MPLKDKEARNTYNRKWKAEHPEKRYAKTHPMESRMYQRKWQKESRERIKLETLHLLGNKCVKCGFLDIRALEIDHINGDGYIERRGCSSWKRYHVILQNIKNNSKNYQLLCANCNRIKKEENHEYA